MKIAHHIIYIIILYTRLFQYIHILIVISSRIFKSSYIWINE